MKRILAAAITLFCVLPVATAQMNSHKPFSIWNVHAFEMGYPPEQRTTNVLGVLTPEKPITIRRVEAISNIGPQDAPLRYGTQSPPPDPVPCRAQYTIELTNGIVTQTIPISNVFIQKKSSQTYTDSGPLNLSFNARTRITVSVTAPKPEFPPVRCSLSGLNMSVQYEVTEISPETTAAAKP